MSELPADYVATMLKAIVGFEIEVERLEGKFKLSQNRPAETGRVIAQLEARGDPELAALMREHPPARKG
jgi:transcriptional regulator